MKKTIKKVMASVMAITSLAIGMIGVNANAADTDPTTVSNITIAPMNTGYWYYTPTRTKSNNSKAYLYVVSGTFSPLVKICGTNNSSGTGGTNCTLNSSGNPVSYLGASIGGTLYIRNNVRDNYNYANLGFQSSYSNMGGSIDVSWAPCTN